MSRTGSTEIPVSIGLRIARERLLREQGEYDGHYGQKMLWHMALRLEEGWQLRRAINVPQRLQNLT